MEMTKQLVLRLPENVHRELKILAATNGQSMTEMILNWLKDKVQGLRNKTEIDPVLAALTDPITPQERRKLREYSDESASRICRSHHHLPEVSPKRPAWKANSPDSSEF